MEVECIGNTQIIHMEETGMTQRTIGLMSEKNLKTHFNFDVIGLWLKVNKNAHCENIHTAYAAVIYQTGPKILAHFTIQSNVA